MNNPIPEILLLIIASVIITEAIEYPILILLLLPICAIFYYRHRRMIQRLEELKTRVSKLDMGIQEECQKQHKIVTSNSPQS